MNNFLDCCVVGDTVSRFISTISTPMKLVVTQITEDRIICGDWEFDRVVGGEIDEYLGWDGKTKTGSYIIYERER
jgi:hypothetical protein